MIENPIIRGFNPDPSIIRINDDYYIATSTFEWYPGINIYHSRDLVNWRLHSRPLNRKSLLDLTGVPDSGGIWAPCLTYDGKKVYLVYTVVKERGAMMQTDNYLIETDDINKGWSDRIYLNSIGFDPSLFHDDDGKKYLISLENHYEKNKRFNGLYIEEYDDCKKCLIGGRRLLYSEPTGELVEGAHLYKKDGYYYLLKAQGGTGVRHSAQMARSKSLMSVWEEDSEILIHSRDNEKLPLQKAGHADIVETPQGVYMVHLASRGLGGILGRETCLQKVIWKDGWLRIENGGENPFVKVECEGDRSVEKEIYYDFKHKDSLSDFQSLRDNIDHKITFGEKGIRLKGGSGLNSKFDQTMLARRVDENNIKVETKLCFTPETDRQMAGVVFFYDTCHWIYLYATKKKENTVKLLSCDSGKLSYWDKEVRIGDETLLGAELNGTKIDFFVNGEKVFKNIDASILSDEHVFLGFTGAMLGINCIDCEKRMCEAEFEYFKYVRC